MVLPDDRRNDVGTKIILAVYSSVVAVILGLFVNAAWAVASKGEIKAELALDKSADLEAKYQKLDAYFMAVQDDLKEIKQLLRRTTSQESGR